MNLPHQPPHAARHPQRTRDSLYQQVVGMQAAADRLQESWAKLPFQHPHHLDLEILYSTLSDLYKQTSTHGTRRGLHNLEIRVDRAEADLKYLQRFTPGDEPPPMQNRLPLGGQPLN